ncbi:MAG: glycosyl transferase family 2 [Lachnospiraceae bacterium]|jgi:glycosyltransferase involved in cell wall biosynthesis|nr:glycosyl transferase family 2 [Lachnospiraceae bacterium]
MVNIIMTSYNGEKYIKEQIESIRASYYKNWRLWIFDDGSKDTTKQIVEDIISKDPNRIHFQVNDKNKGVTRNFLDGILYLKQEIYNYSNDSQDYYMFCDQDDKWMPDKIDRTLNQMKKAEKTYGADSVLAVFTDALVVDKELKPLEQSFYKNSNLNTKKVDLPHILMENKMIGCTIMFNHALFLKISKIPENARYHDWWIALIASAFGYISFLPEPTLLYRQHGNNIVGNKNFISYVKKSATSLLKQREIIEKTILQGRDFLRIYQQELSPEDKKILSTFAYLMKENWWKRRMLLAKYRFTKTGFLRNVGLFIII